MEPESISNRVVINVFLNGQVSIAMDFKRVKRVIDLAYGRDTWIDQALERYQKFSATVPEKFRKSLEPGGNIHDCQQYFWGLVSKWKTKEVSKREALTSLCLNVGVDAPYNVKIFGADRLHLEEERIH
jgi:hypothetical protein